MAAAAFADPARRVDGRRVFSLHAMLPPLAVLLELARRIPALGVKVAPGVADHEIPAQAAVEFISHQGVCKEAVLWFGPLADAAPARRWASVCTGDGAWHQLAGPGQAAPVEPLPSGPQLEGLYLHEPDPAVIRAGVLDELCRDLDAHLFDEQIAYLVNARPASHPLAQSFRLLEVHDFSLKRINRRLQALGMGRLEIKKRDLPSIQRPSDAASNPRRHRPPRRDHPDPDGRAADCFDCRAGAGLKRRCGFQPHEPVQNAKWVWSKRPGGVRTPWCERAGQTNCEQTCEMCG